MSAYGTPARETPVQRVRAMPRCEAHPWEILAGDVCPSCDAQASVRATAAASDRRASMAVVRITAPRVATPRARPKVTTPKRGTGFCGAPGCGEAISGKHWRYCEAHKGHQDPQRYAARHEARVEQYRAQGLSSTGRPLPMCLCGCGIRLTFEQTRARKKCASAACSDKVWKAQRAKWGR